MQQNRFMGYSPYTGMPRNHPYEPRGYRRREKHDYGGEPYVVNIQDVTLENKNYRKAIWTGEHLQVTVMSIDVGDDIGLEVHEDVDQFIRIEEGEGLTEMGPREDYLPFTKKVYDDDAIMVPAGVWHNVTNTGEKPLKVYAIYAPPEHPKGTLEPTKADADESHNHGNPGNHGPRSNRSYSYYPF